MKQHVTNPESCIQCSACEMACPNKAIQCISGRFCIDYSLCGGCRKCVQECPTGAADTFIEVEQPYSVFEQADWQTLP